MYKWKKNINKKVSLEISCGAYKLPRTPRLEKKEGKSPFNTVMNSVV